MTELARLTELLAPAYRVEHAVADTHLGSTVFARTRQGRGAYVTVITAGVVARLPDPQRFLDEIERAGGVDHPAVLPVLAAGRTAGDELFVATDGMVDGEPARDRVGRDGTLASTDVRAIGRAIAGGLDAIHRRGLVHGAITPDVVFLGPDLPRLGWIGVHGALVAGGVDPDDAVLLLGSRAYAAPELLEGRALDARTDVYGLGATLYELLTGRPPFGGRTTATVMATVLADENVERQADPSDDAIAPILRAIEKDPEDRWPTATAFAMALSGRHPTPSGVRAPVRSTGCLPLGIAVAGGGLELVRRLFG